MGRKLEFSRDKALHTAMESFWQNGYDQTSMRDLASRLGLHLGSVYNAFGDKEKVFESSLKLNFDEYLKPQLKALQEDHDALGALERYMTKVIDECLKPDAHAGCFVTNSLQEISSINDNITAGVRAYLACIEDAFTHCLERAQAAGQVPAGKDARVYARFMMGLLFSIRALAKLKMPPEGLHDIRSCAFTALAA